MDNKKYSIYKKIIFKKELIAYFIFINLILPISSNLANELKDSFITLKINKKGNIQILYSINLNDGAPFPNEIYINEQKVNQISSNYNLNEETNIVKLVWNNKINTTKCMFIYCYDINEIDLSKFDASQVTNMDGMLAYCSSLTSLNISNFDISKVTNMEGMFSHCISLTSLNLSNLKTSNVNKMYGMFYNCSSLISLNLSNFDTSNVENMEAMFSFCSSLTSLNLKDFDISKVNNMHRMFEGSLKLEYLNFKKAKITNGANTDNIFPNFQNNFVICSSDEGWKNILKEYNEFIYCIDNMNNNYEYKCYKKTSNNLNNKNICQYCGLNYYVIYNDSNAGIYSNCYQSTPEGYYFDHINSIYKLCYQSCKKCDLSGNEVSHNCIECKENYIYKLNISIYINCYIKCPENYKKLIIDKNECIDECNKDPFFKYEYNNICYKECPNNTFNESFHCKIGLSELLKEKIKYLINHYKNISDYNEFEIEEEIKDEKKDFRITLTTTKIQKINENKNISTINFGKCEFKLKDEYNITYNESLYILKIDAKEQGMKIPKIEYEVYYPLYENEELTKLNLTLCTNLKATLFIPVSLNDDLNKHDPNSQYYNNICSKAISEKATDLTLKERKNIFVNNNMTLCEEGCNLIHYNYSNKKSKCSCNIKIKLPLIEEIQIDKNQLYKSFTDISNIANIKLLKCYKEVLNKKNLTKNYGFYILISIIIIYFISLILFYSKYYIKIKNEINLIVKSEKISLSLKKNSNKAIGQKKSYQMSKVTNRKIKINNDSIKKVKKISTNKNKTKTKASFPPIKLKQRYHKNLIEHKKTKSNKSVSKFIMNTKNENKTNNNKIYKENLNYNDLELNSLKYEKALIHDKRAYVQYYISLLKANNLLIFSFYCGNKDYNSQIIKIFSFFFFFAVNLTTNALFFNDKYIKMKEILILFISYLKYYILL